MKRLDLTRPPIVLLCFGSLIQVYISSQCFTPYVYDSTKEHALGTSYMAACIVTEKNGAGEHVEKESRRIDDPLWVDF
jgi:hypothetical protein